VKISVAVCSFPLKKYLTNNELYGKKGENQDIPLDMTLIPGVKEVKL